MYLVTYNYSCIASHVGRHRLGGDMKLQILPIPYLLSLVNVNECLILSVPPTTPRHGWRLRAPSDQQRTSSINEF